MKKLIATLSTILIAASLFAVVVTPEGPQFSLNAQVKGILFHGFTTQTYESSDALLAAQNDIEAEAAVYELDLSSDDAQSIGSYAFYSTNKVKSVVTFVTTPLKFDAADGAYYVPYELTYTSSLNDKITFLDKAVGTAQQATQKGDDLEASGKVLETSKSSAGLRYGILDLSVAFLGTQNQSFGLPEASGDTYYTGTITAKISVN